MLAFQTYAPVAARDDRMEQRVSKSDKLLIEQAAALQGLKASEFVTSVAVTAARDTLSRLSTTVIKAEDVATFMQAFDDAPANKTMTDLFRLHKEVSGT